MGNQLIKDYTIEKEPTGTGGLGNIWKIYRGVRTDASRRQVSIFILEKKLFKKIPKAQREPIYGILRREALALGRFRHSGIVSLVEPLKEDDKSMAFVTERIECTLQSILDPRKFGTIVQTELEVKVHVLELLETLKFLHNDTKTAHLALNPDNVYLMPDGKWKLGGLLFACQVMPGTLVECPTIDYFTPNLADMLNISLLPDLKFTPPEVVTSPARCALSSDVFALGALIFTLATIKPSDFQAPVLIEVRNAEIYNEGYSRHRGKLDKLPPGLQATLERMVSENPMSRPSLEDVGRAPWLQDPILQALKQLEGLGDRDLSSQQNFLQGLSRVFSRFEQKVLVNRVLPVLSALLRIDQLSPLLLAILLRLYDSKAVTRDDWARVVWPGIVNMTRVAKELPAQTLFLLVYRLSLFHEIVSKDDFGTVLVPLLFRSFDSGVPRLQELCLKVTEDFLVRALDYTIVKAKVLPRVLSLCYDNNADTRRNALVCLLHVHSLIDKTATNDHVLMALEKVRRMTNSPQVNALVLTIYDICAKTLPVDTLATRLLASMVPVLVEPTISKREFLAYFNTVSGILQRIKEDRLAAFGAGQDGPEAQESFRHEIVVSDISKEILRGEDRANKATSPEDWDFLSALDPSFRTDFYSQPMRRPSESQPTQQRPVQMQPTQMQHTQMQPTQMQPNQMQQFPQSGGGFPPMAPAVVTGIPVFQDSQVSWQESPHLRMSANQGQRPKELPLFNDLTIGTPTNAPSGNFFTLGTTSTQPQANQMQGGWDSRQSFNPVSNTQSFAQQQQVHTNPQQRQFAVNPMQAQGNMGMQGNVGGQSNMGGQLPKGNMMKLDYDPFADLGNLTSGIQSQPVNTVPPWSSPTVGVPGNYNTASQGFNLGYPSNSTVQGPPQGSPPQGPPMTWKKPSGGKDIDLL